MCVIYFFSFDKTVLTNAVIRLRIDEYGYVYKAFENRIDNRNARVIFSENTVRLETMKTVLDTLVEWFKSPIFSSKKLYSNNRTNQTIR